MKKLLSLLFAITIFFSLATRALAQPDDATKGQATETQTKKKKHHKKKHKHLLVVKGIGSVEVINTTSIGSNRQQA
jgi:hypothetical protein